MELLILVIWFIPIELPSLLELRSAIYIACLRLCISVTMSAWRTKLFPSNKYLSVSNNLAWNYLNKIKNEDLTILSNEMTNYVKS